ncbi:MAG: hypothetical protein DMF52_12485 [Acidobacteria bacterium]|nr:MAG: hypothetical protein DMF52_12485 [Acidobacteriota bacterium]
MPQAAPAPKANPLLAPVASAALDRIKAKYSEQVIEAPKPFEVVYHLFSITTRQRLNLKLDVGEVEQPPTASRVWPTANWHEREVFDLFGIRFHGHPDMTRILMTDEWVGHPLRKDYPLEGKPEDHMQLREVTTAEHVYTYDKSSIKGFGWKKEVEKTGEGRG